MEEEEIHKETFDAYYERELLPALRELEAERKSIKSTLIYPTLGLGALALGLIAILPNLGIQSLVLAGITGVGLFTWFKTKASREYRAEFKNRIIRQIVRHIDKDFRYSGYGGLKKSEFTSCGIFTRQPDRYRGEDLISGELEQTVFSFSEVHSQIYVKDSEGRRKLQTQFKGLFFKADFNKFTKHRTVIVPDIAERFLGNMGQQLQKLNFGRDELVQMENVDFEKVFAVYSSDQVEARYILSPKLMERILAYSEKHEVTPSLSFKDSTVFVAIPISKDFFEPRIFRTIIEKETTREYHDDMMLAISLVEELDLNTRIWTKMPKDEEEDKGPSNKKRRVPFGERVKR
ncbi:MAG: DUF3137 domain-containing protein [Flavobacteriales bacterium]|nr:DUF3137 domain-containing protein [Flavobacteriales bacterium]NNK81218.1 DUF3137 domain-containing protein [Flavobacteriales bacterium]